MVSLCRREKKHAFNVILYINMENRNLFTSVFILQVPKGDGISCLLVYIIFRFHFHVYAAVCVMVERKKGGGYKRLFLLLCKYFSEFFFFPYFFFFIFLFVNSIPFLHILYIQIFRFVQQQKHFSQSVMSTAPSVTCNCGSTNKYHRVHMIFSILRVQKKK